MTSFANRHHAPVALDFAVVSVSCSTQASAQAAGVGPFRGLFFITSASISFVSHSGNTINIDNAAKNTILWIEGAFVSVIATATSQFALY